MSSGAAAPVIGLVGVGGWGRLVLRDLVTLGATVHAVARSPESRARAVEHGATSIVGDVGALPDVDGVVVVSPTPTHASIIRQVANRGVPVFTEKPMCDDPAEADDLVDQLGDRLFVMDKWRYHPGVQTLADLVAAGRLGRVRAMHTTRIGADNPHDDTSGRWVLTPHDLSIVLHVLGELPPVATARLEPDDDGVTAILGQDPWVRVEVSCASAVRRREVRVVGELASASLADGYADSVLLQPRGGEMEELPISTRMPLEAELAAFLAHLGGGPPPVSSAADGALIVRRVAEIAEAAGAVSGAGRAVMPYAP